MTEKKQVYRCNICGNIVDVLENGAGQLVCCGEPMELLEEHTKDTPNEKHVPIIERTDTGYKVTVGAVEHPMDTNHYINWIELIVNDTSFIKTLKPGEKPMAIFQVQESKNVIARAYCNLHGFWKNNYDK